MFCPQCASQNVEGAKFCRACGTDISLLPQLLTGQLAARLAAAEEAPPVRRGTRQEEEEPPTIERAVKSLFMGLAFIFIAFAAKTWAPAGNLWWFWMFLPAAVLLSRGVAAYLRLAAERKEQARQPDAAAQTSFAPSRQASELPPPGTDEMIQPHSVTEATTRHLGLPAEPKRRDG